MVTFPITGSPEHFEDARVQSAISEISEEDRTLIESFQPYGNGCVRDTPNPLGALSALSNGDKHRLLHVTRSGNLNLTITIPAWGQHDCVVTDLTAAAESVGVALQPGMHIARVAITPTGPDPQVMYHVAGESYFCLPDGVHLERRLRDIGDGVEIIMDALAATFV